MKKTVGSFDPKSKSSFSVCVKILVVHFHMTLECHNSASVRSDESVEIRFILFVPW